MGGWLAVCCLPRARVLQVYFERAFDAFYRLSEPGVQIRAHVEDIVRSKVPTMELDHTFETKEEIAHSIRDNLRDVRRRPSRGGGREGGREADAAHWPCVWGGGWVCRR